MSDTIPLLRYPSDGDHLDRLQPYVRSRCGTYHHRPRSAIKRANGKYALTVHAWCGQLLHGPLPLNEPEGPVCGTCEGRFMGWEKRHNLIFSPVDLWGRPRWCPLVTFAAERCPVCGGKRSWRYSRYHGGDPVQHRAEDGIEAWAPCPQHGWKWMHQRDATVVCTYFTTRNEDRFCGYELEEAPR